MTDLMQAEDLYRFARLSDLALAPDGRTVVYGQKRVDEESQEPYIDLWLVSTTDGSPRQFTYGDHVDKQPAWSPAGDQIAFLSNRDDPKQFQLYLIPVSGGEARPLTEFQGEVGRPVWSPDGRWLLCPVRPKDPEAVARAEDAQKQALGVVVRRVTRLQYKEDGYGFLPQTHWGLWRVDLQSGRVEPLLAPEDYDVKEPAWSPDGRLILFHANRSPDPDRQWDQSDLFLLPAEGGTPQRVETRPGPKASPVFSPDGRWLAYYQMGGQTNRWQNTGLWVAPAPGGGASGPARNLTAPFDLHVAQDTINDLGSMQSSPPGWSPDSRLLYFQTTQHGSTPLMALAREGGPPETVIPGPGVVEEFQVDRAGEQVVYLWGDLSEPGQIRRQTLPQGQNQPLTQVNQALLQARRLSPVEEVWFQGPAGNDLQGWIIKPPDFDPARRYPSLLEIHGGPMAQYGHFFMHEFQYLAAQGYVVYFCNPRGGRGYGQAHTRAIANNWGSADYEDVMAWVDWVAEQPYIDLARRGVTGGSYGGYLTAWIIGHTTRFKAAVIQRCVSNLISMVGSTDMGYRFGALLGAEKPPWEAGESYWRQSPLRYVGHVQTPTLVIHSEEDLRCSIEQGEQLFVALKMVGVETELVRFPGESHGLSRLGRTDRRIARLEHIVRWFDRYLK